MACFLVPAGEAIVTTIVTKVIESREKAVLAKLPDSEAETAASHKPAISSKMKWLNNMLWGGSALLMFEHIWHGEVVPWFPFLTAAADPADTAEMLSEMSTVGVSMALAVTGVWAVMAAVSSVIEKRKTDDSEKTESESAA
ncbi:MAG: hypothetical protein IK990_09870 [Ruminiclostridium sp.]|nr:hypothetical protein [Ruminiclostridium sp.]